MEAVLGPPHTYSASTARRIRSLAKRSGCDVHTLQLALETTAARIWPSKWKTPRQKRRTTGRAA